MKVGEGLLLLVIEMLVFSVAVVVEIQALSPLLEAILSVVIDGFLDLTFRPIMFKFAKSTSIADTFDEEPTCNFPFMSHCN